MNISLNYNSISQIAHTLGGCFIAEHLGRWTGKHVLALLIVFILAAFKEFFLDARYEDVESRGSDLVDFLFWSLGGIIGLLLSY